MLVVQEARQSGVFDQQALRGALDTFISRRREGARKERLPVRTYRAPRN
jgi:hypothetical protein